MDSFERKFIVFGTIGVIGFFCHLYIDKSLAR